MADTKTEIQREEGYTISSESGIQDGNSNSQQQQQVINPISALPREESEGGISDGEKTQVEAVTSESSVGSPAMQLDDSVLKKSNSSGKGPAGKKRRRLIKDINAPRAPLTGYVRFLNDHREKIRSENPELPFHEITKILGQQWSNLQQDQKQQYLEEAEKDKERYMSELEDYQQSELYKDFMERKRKEAAELNIPETDDELYCRPCNQHFNSIHNKREHLSGRRHLQVISEQIADKGSVKQDVTPFAANNTETSFGVTKSMHQSPATSFNSNKAATNSQPEGSSGKASSGPKLTIEGGITFPIFTDEFLGYCRSKESDLRRLRKVHNGLEEQNGILNKQIDNMKLVTEKLKSEIVQQEDENTALQSYLDKLRSNLVMSFSSVTQAKIGEKATIDNIDECIFKLAEIVNSNDTAEAKDFKDQIKKIIKELDYPALRD